MARYYFDCETNGFLEDLDVIHSLVLKDMDTGERISCTDSDPVRYRSIKEGLKLLRDAELIVGHNIIKFDLPAIQKVYPKWKPKGVIRDTLVMARLIFPKDDIKSRDFRRLNDGFPKKMIGAQSLEAWGHRLGLHKGDYAAQMKAKGLDPWAHWNVEMQDYCELDVDVTEKLWGILVKKGFSEQSIELEHAVQHIILRQERYGFLFNREKAVALYGVLSQRKQELEAELAGAFPPWEVETVFVPKANNKKLGYVKGVPFTKRRTVYFKPSSLKHIIHVLKTKYGWEPVEYTEKGEAKMDEEVLSALPYPEAPVLSEYLMVCKRLGQLATGKEAWLKHLGKDGRIHGEVITNGAVTGRMTHMKPNVAQVPGLTDKKTGQPMPYGMECRELFCVPKGKKLVGCDADALELRCLAGYMAKFDGGAYIETVLRGDKSKGTDMHTLNAKALGCKRDTAKTWFYAFIYGSGDENLGHILGVRGELTVNPRTGKLEDRKAKAAGKKSRNAFLDSLQALSTIIQKVQEKTEKKGFLKGLDGRQLRVRSSHSAFNTLLQSAGAILMKQALVILDADIQAAGLIPGVHYEFVANVHDEWQIEVDEDKAEFVGQTAKTAIRKAGEHFNFGCPLDGAYDYGDNWASTH